MAAGAQPGPILPRLPGTESPFCSLPHPPLRGREMPSAMNHPRNSSAPLRSPPRRFAIPPRADTPCVGSVPSAGPRRGRGDTSRPQNPSTAGPTSPNPAPHHPRGHRSAPAGMRGARTHPGVFNDSLGIWGFGPWCEEVPVGSGSVLTGPVLVPGVAADGLQQEAVVGHGELAAGGTRAQDAPRATGTTPGDTSPFHPPKNNSPGRGFPSSPPAQARPGPTPPQPHNPWQEHREAGGSGGSLITP